MKFHTRVELPAYPFRIGHRSPSLFLGSCFSDHIGRLMERSLFPVRLNPFGTIYNPESVARALEALLHKQQYSAEDLQQHDGKWFSFDHSTKFSDPDQARCLERINREFSAAREDLSGSRVITLTWGTSWVYRYKESGEVVCNCHKIPESRFERFRLPVRQVIERYSALLPSLFERDPERKVLLTVSPVRHWKDGARGNQLSKSILLLAAEALEKEFPGRVFYFPAYEIVMDELRDYRYYASDMLHMSDQAVEYIWERFRESLISEESNRAVEDLEPLLKLREHRKRNESEAETGPLRDKHDRLIAQLSRKYPFLNLESRSHE